MNFRIAFKYDYPQFKNLYEIWFTICDCEGNLIRYEIYTEFAHIAKDIYLEIIDKADEEITLNDIQNYLIIEYNNLNDMYDNDELIEFTYDFSCNYYDFDGYKYNMEMTNDN